VIVGYARVSTKSDEQAISIEAQVEQLTAAGCTRVIQERGSAFREGSRRPGWEELQALVASGQVSKVIAVSQSRLSRREDVTAFLRICSRKRVEVQFLDGTPGDIADPAARLMTGVMATINEVDSQIKGINIKNGLQRRKAAGYYACGRVPFGYAYDGQYVVPHPTEFEEAKLLWQRLSASEFNLAQTVRLHGYDWSTRGLRRWIHNPILRGIVSGQAMQVEPLITPQDYADAAALMERRREKGTRAPRRKRLLSGLVRCQQCQRWLHYAMAAGKQRLKCTNLHCGWYGRGLAEWKIREQVIATLEGCHAQMAELAAAAPELVVTQEQLEMQRDLEDYLEKQARGRPNLEAAIRDLQQQLQTPLPSAPNWAALAAVLARPGVLNLASDEELRALLLEFVDEILYIGDPMTVEVRLR
jgi:DNA invertase Pin-like site-specific DNA recombinase